MVQGAHPIGRFQRRSAYRICLRMYDAGLCRTGNRQEEAQYVELHAERNEHTVSSAPYGMYCPHDSS